MGWTGHSSTGARDMDTINTTAKQLTTKITPVGLAGTAGLWLLVAGGAFTAGQQILAPFFATLLHDLLHGSAVAVDVNKMAAGAVTLLAIAALFAKMAKGNIVVIIFIAIVIQSGAMAGARVHIEGRRVAHDTKAAMIAAQSRIDAEVQRQTADRADALARIAAATASAAAARDAVITKLDASMVDANGQTRLMGRAYRAYVSREKTAARAAYAAAVRTATTAIVVPTIDAPMTITAADVAGDVEPFSYFAAISPAAFESSVAIVFEAVFGVLGLVLMWLLRETRKHIEVVQVAGQTVHFGKNGGVILGHYPSGKPKYLRKKPTKAPAKAPAKAPTKKLTGGKTAKKLTSGKTTKKLTGGKKPKQITAGN